MRVRSSLCCVGTVATVRNQLAVSTFTRRSLHDEGGISHAFNRATKRKQREAAAVRPDSRDFDYLRDEVATRIVDRLGDIKRTFPVALDLGCHAGQLSKQLVQSSAGGIQQLYLLDDSDAMINRDATERAQWSSHGVMISQLPATDYDGGGIPLPNTSVDLVVSNLALHWVNALPELLRDIRRVLKPDGVFLAACLGGDTLAELRSAFVAAETERCGGVSPHVSPMLGVADAGNLLAAAGFGMPTVDADTFAIGYPTPAALLEHLQGMGENGAALAARPGARRELLLAAMSAYTAMYGDANDDGAVPATFEVIHMIGWEPAPAQPFPLPRGSVPKGFAARGNDGPLQ